MKKDIDELLKHALTPNNEPDFWLNQRILNHEKEIKRMKKGKLSSIPRIALITATVLSMGSITTFAAWKYLSPDKVAEVTKDSKLIEAFKSEDAITINEKQSYAGYDITLLGMVSGKNITEYVMEDNGEIKEDRTYSVVAIEKSDQTPMPSPSDEQYNEVRFLVSPLIKGYNPNEFNMMTMNGGYIDIVEAGVLYRLSECDNIEMFANQDIYLCVSEGTFYNPAAYHFDEATGEITRNEAFEGVNALFDLPIDSSKADEAAVAAYIQAMDETDEVEALDKVTDIEKWMANLDANNIDEYATRVEETVQTVTPDSKGYIHIAYSYQNGSYEETNLVSNLFPQGNNGVNEYFGYHFEEEDLETLEIYRYTLNEEGTVTFALYVPKES